MATPKNQESRDVDLTKEVVELLGQWWAESNKPTDNGALVFAGDGKDQEVGELYVCAIYTGRP